MKVDCHSRFNMHSVECTSSRTPTFPQIPFSLIDPGQLPGFWCEHVNSPSVWANVHVFHGLHANYSRIPITLLCFPLLQHMRSLLSKATCSRVITRNVRPPAFGIPSLGRNCVPSAVLHLGPQRSRQSEPPRAGLRRGKRT
jgi:hypothetical protein